MPGNGFASFWETTHDWNRTMTDNELSRIDLRGLGIPDDPSRTDAVVAGVMQRITRPVSLVRAQRWVAAVAAVLVCIAVVTVLRSGARTQRDPDPLGGWTASGHVPTNAELLAVYQGYRP